MKQTKPKLCLLVKVYLALNYAILTDQFQLYTTRQDELFYNKDEKLQYKNSNDLWIFCFIYPF